MNKILDTMHKKIEDLGYDAKLALGYSMFYLLCLFTSVLLMVVL